MWSSTSPAPGIGRQKPSPNNGKEPQSTEKKEKKKGDKRNIRKWSLSRLRRIFLSLLCALCVLCGEKHFRTKIKKLKFLKKVYLSPISTGKHPNVDGIIVGGLRGRWYYLCGI
jgi:hypothetical protein